MGWLMGFEPTTLGTTNRCSNQLSYSHHGAGKGNRTLISTLEGWHNKPLYDTRMARPKGLEPPALWAETTRSNPTELRAPMMQQLL